MQDGWGRRSSVASPAFYEESGIGTEVLSGSDPCVNVYIAVFEDYLIYVIYRILFSCLYGPYTNSASSDRRTLDQGGLSTIRRLGPTLRGTLPAGLQGK